MKSFLFLLIFSFFLTLSAKEFGSKEEGFLLNLPDDWNTSRLLSSLIGKAIGSGEESVQTKLTAYKGSDLKNTLILNLMTFETEANLLFNVKAVQDALEKEKNTKIVSRKKIRIGDLDTVRIEYIRGSNRVIQYLLVNKSRLWSLLFLSPKDISRKNEEEISTAAKSFRLAPEQ